MDDGTVVAMANPTQFYKYADVDDQGVGNISYYGAVDVDGNWFIMKEDRSVTPNTYRYFKGSSGYPAAFVARAGLAYDYFYNIF